MNFSVGQRIRCVLPHPEWEAVGCRVPKVGATYTVRAIDETDGVLLAEIVNDGPGAFLWSIDAATGQRIAPGEESFWQHRFAVAERTTDISIFKKILDKARKRKAVHRV
jgi:hypothetical protein